MNETTQPIVHETPDTALNGNRKLIRPRLPAAAHTPQPAMATALARSIARRRRMSTRSSSQPEPSHAEVFYFQKQVQAQTPMVVLLDDGEKLEGVIEWFDKDSLKLRLTNLQRVLVYKTAIKFIHKAGEAAT